MFEKNDSLQVSEKFFKKLEDKLKGCSINGYYNTFNNCREQGLVLKLYNHNYSLHIWACQCRNSDQIMIVIGNEDNTDINDMFDEKAYENAKYFSYNKYDSAVSYVYQHIKYMFKDLLKTEKHFKFDIYKSINQIRKIFEDAKDLDYEDYYELASFFDEEDNYSCDLVIQEGKMGLRYNKYNNYDKEILIFKECNLNLESEATLMLDMKKQLEQFINEELEYSISMNTDIKMERGF